jgi:hypothetical protein
VGGILGAGLLMFGLRYCWHHLRSSGGWLSFYVVRLVDFFIARATKPRLKILITFYRASLALAPSTSGLTSHCLVAAVWSDTNPETDGSRLASTEVVVVLPNVSGVDMPPEYCKLPLPPPPSQPAATPC